MRSIRLTKPQVSWFKSIAALFPAIPVHYSAILTKIEEAQEPLVSTGVYINPLQDVLIASAGNKVVSLTDNVGLARASKQASLLGLTSESTNDFRLMGEWISTQQWIKASNGVLTIIDVLNKWSQWWPKVKAMTNANPRPNTNNQGPVLKTGRTAQGFR